MRNTSEYDERQLKLMENNIIAYEKNQMELQSLIGSLEFLFNVLESTTEDWDTTFLEEISNLETINAIDIAITSGENITGLEEKMKKKLIDESIIKLKKIIRNTINE